MPAKTKPKDVALGLRRVGGNEVEGYGNAALMFEDVALRSGHKGATKMPSMSLEVGIRPRIEYSEACDQNSSSTYRRF
jgi:hypothetical protein